MEKVQFEVVDSISDFLLVNKMNSTDSLKEHLYKICIYFNDLDKKLSFFKTLNNARTIASISRAIKLSRVAIYKNEILIKYINHRNDDLENLISNMNISDCSTELQKEITLLNKRDVTIENITFENDNLRQENIHLLREVDRLKKQISLKKS